MNTAQQQQFEQIIYQIRFQLENVEGWLSVGKTEAAEIKATCLVEEAKRLDAFLSTYKSTMSNGRTNSC